MKYKELEGYLSQSLKSEVEARRLDETVSLCIEIMKKQSEPQVENRTDFLQYLSDVFRFEGIAIFGLQAITLLIVCLGISTIAEMPENIPIFMPLFAFALVPVLFRSQMYRMCEMEAVTRTSGAQLILAKLLLAGAANLVCMTLILFLEIYLRNSSEGIGQMILYILVPYLVCMSIMLLCLRMSKEQGAATCIVFILSSCIGWGISVKVFPWLYETSAGGVWILAFVFFAAFFTKELFFIIKMRKEGYMYGIIH